jgi:ATP-dependent Lon protease
MVEKFLKIETVTMPGKGRMQITGKLGDVMQESVKAAKSFVRSKCLEYGIIPPLFEKKDFHIHVPEGATPKDGPSAGNWNGNFDSFINYWNSSKKRCCNDR